MDRYKMSMKVYQGREEIKAERPEVALVKQCYLQEKEIDRFPNNKLWTATAPKLERLEQIRDQPQKADKNELNVG